MQVLKSEFFYNRLTKRLE